MFEKVLKKLEYDDLTIYISENKNRSIIFNKIIQKEKVYHENNELMNNVLCSKSTFYRHLKKLENNNLVERVWGSSKVSEKGISVVNHLSEESKREVLRDYMIYSLREIKECLYCPF